MKASILLCTLLFVPFAKGNTLSSNIQKAEKAAMEMTKVDYAHLKERLSIKVVTISEKANQVKVELGVGTIERPSKIYNCMTFTFTQSEEGFIEKVENEIDSGFCTF